MKKQMMKLSVVTSLMLVGLYTTNASAAGTAVVTVSGTVNNATCNLTASKKDVSLKSQKTSAFTNMNTAVGDEGTFDITLSDCSTETLITGSSVGLLITGPVSSVNGADDTFFNANSSGDVGVSLLQKGKDTKEIRNGEVIKAPEKLGGTTDLSKQVGAYNNTVFSFSAKLKSAVAGTSLKPQSITAPLTFTFVYM